jgi:cytochrome P450
MASTLASTDGVDLDFAAGESPAGAVDGSVAIVAPPRLRGPAFVQTLRFAARPLAFQLGEGRDLGDVFSVRVVGRDVQFVLTKHPDHVKALFTARPDDAPSVTRDSPLRPILGPDSVLTAIGPRHLRQRRLLLPPFHGEAIGHYEQIISAAIERELDSWQVGDSFALAPRMSAVTLDVIMAGVFGIEGTPAPGSAEGQLRRTTRRFLDLSTRPPWQLVELANMGREHPRGPLKPIMRAIDKRFYAVIAERRARGPQPGDKDVLSLLMAAHDEDGNALTDAELRDQLLSLVLAGHETTANQLAWTFERLVRTPDAYAALRDVARADNGDPDRYVEATIHEAMRVRPVIPLVGRAIQQPWRLGRYVIPAGSIVTANIIGLHHRPDVYPDPLRFDPARFVGRKPGTYTWIPFGGGIRRCLGAALAMAEQRIVLQAIARRTDLAYVNARPERGSARNVTMIPHRGGRVRLLASQPA